jgi:hypothetical protein
MKRNLLLFILTCCALSLAAQNEMYKISGVVIDKPEAKYAYLVSFYKSVTRTPIVNGRFEFNLKKDRELDMRALMIRADSVVTYEMFMQQKSAQADDSRTILIDNLEVETGKIVANALVRGSSLNQDLDDMFATIKSQDYTKYFANHSDSPVSMLFLKSLAQIASGSSMFASYDCKTYYNLLSDRLKQSPDGLLLAQKIR